MSLHHNGLAAYNTAYRLAGALLLNEAEPNYKVRVSS